MIALIFNFWREIFFEQQLFTCTRIKCTHGVIMIFIVQIDKKAKKELRRVPNHIVVKLRSWVDSVESFGIETVRKIPGFHDEPLKGKREGQRSIRLSKSYRAIYTVEGSQIKIAVIKEVNKHEY